MLASPSGACMWQVLCSNIQVLLCLFQFPTFAMYVTQTYRHRNQYMWWANYPKWTEEERGPMWSPTPTPEVQTQFACSHQNGITSTGFEGFFFFLNDIWSTSGSSRFHPSPNFTGGRPESPTRTCKLIKVVELNSPEWKLSVRKVICPSRTKMHQQPANIFNKWASNVLYDGHIQHQLCNHGET